MRTKAHGCARTSLVDRPGLRARLPRSRGSPAIRDGNRLAGASAVPTSCGDPGARPREATVARASLPPSGWASGRRRARRRRLRPRRKRPCMHEPVVRRCVSRLRGTHELVADGQAEPSRLGRVRVLRLRRPRCELVACRPVMLTFPSRLGGSARRTGRRLTRRFAYWRGFSCPLGRPSSAASRTG